MSRTYHHGERRIKVRGIRRDQPDLRRVARAVVELAQMRAEALAEAEHRRALDVGRRNQAPEPQSEADSGGNHE